MSCFQDYGQLTTGDPGLSLPQQLLAVYGLPGSKALYFSLSFFTYTVHVCAYVRVGTLRHTGTWEGQWLPLGCLSSVTYHHPPPPPSPLPHRAECLSLKLCHFSLIDWPASLWGLPVTAPPCMCLHGCL